MTLTDTHLVLLSAASQRADALLPRPNKLAGAALQKLAAALVKAGLAESVLVHADQPHWRTDEEHYSVGLKITRAGLDAIGVETSALSAESAKTATQQTADLEVADPAKPSLGGDLGLSADANRKTPRAGTKLAGLVALLSAEGGSTLDELVNATGWLPHTTRAALTRLRQNGHDISKGRNEQNRTSYRITPQESAAHVEPASQNEAA